MCAQRETVGHARDVVGRLGDPVGVVVAVRGWQVVGVAQVVVHQAADDVDRLARGGRRCAGAR